jgi:hypothetical protein
MKTFRDLLLQGARKNEYTSGGLDKYNVQKNIVREVKLNPKKFIELPKKAYIKNNVSAVEKDGVVPRVGKQINEQIQITKQQELTRLKQVLNKATNELKTKFPAYSTGQVLTPEHQQAIDNVQKAEEAIKNWVKELQRNKEGIETLDELTSKDFELKAIVDEIDKEKEERIAQKVERKLELEPVVAGEKERPSLKKFTDNIEELLTKDFGPAKDNKKRKFIEARLLADYRDGDFEKYNRDEIELKIAKYGAKYEKREPLPSGLEGMTPDQMIEFDKEYGRLSSDEKDKVLRFLADKAKSEKKTFYKELLDYLTGSVRNKLKIINQAQNIPDPIDLQLLELQGMRADNARRHAQTQNLLGQIRNRLGQQNINAGQVAKLQKDTNDLLKTTNDKLDEVKQKLLGTNLRLSEKVRLETEMNQLLEDQKAIMETQSAILSGIDTKLWNQSGTLRDIDTKLGTQTAVQTAQNQVLEGMNTQLGSLEKGQKDIQSQIDQKTDALRMGVQANTMSQQQQDQFKNDIANLKTALAESERQKKLLQDELDEIESLEQIKRTEAFRNLQKEPTNLGEELRDVRPQAQAPAQAPGPSNSYLDKKKRIENEIQELKERISKINSEYMPFTDEGNTPEGRRQQSIATTLGNEIKRLEGQSVQLDRDYGMLGKPRGQGFGSGAFGDENKNAVGCAFTIDYKAPFPQPYPQCSQNDLLSIKFKNYLANKPESIAVGDYQHTGLIPKKYEDTHGGTVYMPMEKEPFPPANLPYNVAGNHQASGGNMADAFEQGQNAFDWNQYPITGYSKHPNYYYDNLERPRQEVLISDYNRALAKARNMKRDEDMFHNGVDENEIGGKYSQMDKLTGEMGIGKIRSHQDAHALGGAFKRVMDGDIGEGGGILDTIQQFLGKKIFETFWKPIFTSGRGSGIDGQGGNIFSSFLSGLFEPARIAASIVPGPWTAFSKVADSLNVPRVSDVINS